MPTLPSPQTPSNPRKKTFLDFIPYPTKSSTTKTQDFMDSRRKSKMASRKALPQEEDYPPLPPPARPSGLRPATPPPQLVRTSTTTQQVQITLQPSAVALQRNPDLQPLPAVAVDLQSSTVEIQVDQSKLLQPQQEQLNPDPALLDEDPGTPLRDEERMDSEELLRPSPPSSQQPTNQSDSAPPPGPDHK